MPDKLLSGFLAVALVLALAGPALAREPVPAGRFDYYVLSLSWAPQFCASGGARGGNEECAPQRHYGFVLHGLWPQYATHGYPESCPSAAGRVPEPVFQQMLPIMPARGLVQHEWDKHGTCSGLSIADYFALATRAYRAIRVPEPWQQPAGPVSVAVETFRTTFLAANPGLKDNQMTMFCKGHYLSEIRLCLTRSLQPGPCGPDLHNQCHDDTVVLRAVR